ncbi:flagellin [Nocardioides daphniae]|uniref:Flagellin n=1 Tax=Nocardioides daphniae TaxID=402297 RepID=A0A4P7UFF3_9ACTN|nr:flagellin [Nocardioides daphniae]QCC78145.1 flagellar hook protein [Nocardioides daphniae]GGD21491.1 flagellar hook-associated protein FlgL [Nocardioides daphniae]
MSIQRVTQSMMSQRSLEGLQLSLGRLARSQEQLSTGRVLNRPSDSPTDTTAAMRLRSSLADAKQYVRNAEDGQGWLGQVDTALQSMVNETRRARELVLQGANQGAMSVAAREALAIEVEQLRESLIGQANAKYLERPVFGGVTAGSVAFDADGAYVGTDAGEVLRTVGDGVSVRVDMDARQAFGPDGANLFDDLDAAVNALRSGDPAELSASLDRLAEAGNRMTGALAEIGGRTNRLEAALLRAQDGELSMTSSLSEIENVDLPRAMVDLQLQEVAYQAALGATARVLQPSLLDFLR